MSQSAWVEKILSLQDLIMKPILFDNMKITLIDAVTAYHESGWQVEEHRHPWFEFNYVTDGIMQTATEGISFETGNGAFLILPPGVLHSNEHKNGTPDDGFCLRWQIERLLSPEQEHAAVNSFDQVIKALTHIRPYSTRDKTVDATISELFNKKGFMSLQLAFIRLIVSLFEIWSDEAVANNSHCSRNEVLVQQAVLFLSEYYENHISVGDLVNALHVSYRHLARVFKQVMGVTVIEKLNDIRINKAKTLLIDTDEPIRTISLMVGFENEYYFSRLFSQYTYSTPTEFRKKFRLAK